MIIICSSLATFTVCFKVRMGRLRRLEKAVFHDSYSIVSEETVLRSPSQRLDKLVCRRATGRQMSSHVFLQRNSTSVRRLEILKMVSEI